MSSNPLYISCQPWPWAPNCPRLGSVIICHRNKQKIFYSETARPEACLFSMKQCLVVPYINPANHAPWVQIGYTPGVINSHRITIGKLKNIGNQKVLSCYVLCVAMFSSPFIDPAIHAPGYQTGHTPGASSAQKIFYILENYSKYFDELLALR